MKGIRRVCAAAAATAASLALVASLVTPASAQLSGAESIDWTQVVTTQPTVNYQRDIGSCTCDLTVDVCDVNCCCDSKCTAADKALFSGGCLPEGRTTSSLSSSDDTPYCSNFLLSVNRQSDLGVTTMKNTNGAVCVVKVNNPIQGFFYENPGVLDQVATFNEHFLLSTHKYSVGYDGNEAQKLPTSRGYRYGDPIGVKFVNNAINGKKGTFGVPASLNSEYCSDFSSARFLVDEASTCSRAASCGGDVYNAAYYLDKDKIRFMQSFASDNVITPTTKDPLCLKTDGTTTSCCRNADNDAVPCPAGAAITGAALTFPNSVSRGDGLCYNMVKKAEYLFKYDPETATIVDVEVTFTFGSVDNDVLDAANSGFAQEFVTEFVPSSNVAPFKKSGNPGYVVGNPVLVGQLISQNEKYPFHTTAISYRKSPTLTLAKDTYRSGRMQCAAYDDNDNRVPVTFGEDVATGCTLYQTYAQLTGGCAGIRQAIFNYQLGAFGNSLDRVAKFGNASFLNSFDWIPIIKDIPVELNSNQAGANGVCSSLLTELNVEFVWADFGSSDNPQPGIVGARLSANSGEFSYSCEKQRDCQLGGTDAQKFWIRSTVTWVKVRDQQETMFVPQPPNLIPPIPDDVFYPFKLA